MAEFFPRQTIAWKLEEAAPFRKLSLSLVEMALITGVVLRLFRSLALTYGGGSGWLYYGGLFALGAAFLLAMLTLHLGNYTVRQWLWRAPAFALVVTAAEALTSLVLITLGREPLGTGRAEYHDWLGMMSNLLIWRLIAVAAFAGMLAAVVQVIRYVLLRRDHRETTAERIAESTERRSTTGMPL